jgi:hypothetical protein
MIKMIIVFVLLTILIAFAFGFLSDANKDEKLFAAKVAFKSMFYAGIATGLLALFVILF